MHLIIDTDGRLSFIYDDCLAPLLDLGTAQISRASHVEPMREGGWVADLSVIGGPILGPFPLRSAALSAERDWLESHGY